MLQAVPNTTPRTRFRSTESYASGPGVPPFLPRLRRFPRVKEIVDVDGISRGSYDPGPGSGADAPLQGRPGAPNVMGSFDDFRGGGDWGPMCAAALAVVSRKRADFPKKPPTQLFEKDVTPSPTYAQGPGDLHTFSLSDS